MALSSLDPRPLGPPGGSKLVLPVLRNRRGGRRRWGGSEQGHNSGDDFGGGRPDRRPAGMGPAVLLSGLAVLFAGVVAYGTHPVWAQYPHGLDVILLSRQLQWPFIVLSLVATIVLLATIIAGRRRAWWLIGLAPILALFGHRFATDPTAGMAAIENPAFVAPDAASAFIDTDDYVVGLTFEGKNYAFPYAALYSTPVVIMSQHDKRVMLMWSAPANRALAYTVSRDVKARNLDVVSTPANALLIYDTARGTFINGLTGRTTDGDKPAGFLLPLPTTKMQWWKWRVTYPDTQIMSPAGKLAARAPRQPMKPACPMPPTDLKQPADLKVALVGTLKPAAVQSASLTAAPVNVSADGTPAFAFRDPQTGTPRGFRRRVDDLSPRFKANRDRSRTGVLFIDSDTNSGWSAAGVAIEAKKEFRGKRLPQVPVEDELYWGVMKHWYPELQLVSAETGAPQTVIELNGQSPTPETSGKSNSSGAAQAPAKPGATPDKTGGVTVKPARPVNSVSKRKTP